MELFIAFGVFIAAMLVAVIGGFSMIPPLLIGLAAFLAVGKRRGYSCRSMALMSQKSLLDSLVVIKVMLIIGALTAVWRAAGTITVFVYYGMKVILPPIFLLVTFVLCCLLSYAIGTSFGIAGTVGVIFMALARSGGVDPVIAAGVVMSGIYFGDRCSPVSSSANLVAGVTGTEIYGNVKMMFRTALLPLAAVTAVYAALSFANPVSHVDQEMISAFENEFVLSFWAFVPAVLMIALPFFKVGVVKAMAASIASGLLVACFVQGLSPAEALKICVFGYQAEGEGLAAILNGGGLVSMLEIVGILIISSTYSGIFNGTSMLLSLQDRLSSACRKSGRFAVTLCMSIGVSAVFCNQTIATMMCCDLMKQPYLSGGGNREELAIDLENSVILIACYVPWSIGCSVPMSLLGADVSSLPFAVYMYAVPLFYLLTKRRWFKDKEKS